MTDFDDDLINDAFAGFTAAAAPAVNATGAGAVRHTVKRRRARTTAAFSVLGVLLLAAPALAYASMDRGQGPPVDTATAAPTVSPSVMPSPSAPSAPVGRSLGTCSKPAGVTPAGAIPLSELCNATLAMPTWSTLKNCTSSSVTFRKGTYHVRDSVDVDISAVIAHDVDGDGQLDDVALIRCGGQRFTRQVVAFGRSASGGIETMGQVVITEGPIRTITGIAAAADGAVTVTVGDFGDELGDFRSITQLQQRTYRWDGQRFTQVAGETAFPPNPKLFDLSVTITELKFGVPKGGLRTGTLTVTARNDGPADTPLKVYVNVPPSLSFKSGPAGCKMVVYPSAKNVECTVQKIAAGSAKEFKLVFTAPAGAENAQYDMVPEVSAIDGLGGSGPDKAESDRSDNSAKLVIRYA